MRREKESSFPYENSSEVIRPDRVSDWTQVSLQDTWRAPVLGQTWRYEMFLRFHTPFLH